MKRQFYTNHFSIRNESADSVEIHIDGQIVDAETQEIYQKWFGDETSVSFRSFRNQLNAVNAKVYNVYINSGGGIVTDAMAMHDFLIEIQDKGKTVNTIGRGIIASAATYILMAGKNPAMSKNSWFMIHNVSGFTWGDVNQIENYAVTMRKFNDSVRDFYANATGKRKEDITKMMNAETWMTADEAKDNGFVKEITNEEKFSNAISKEHWQFSNMAVFNAYNSNVGNLPPTPIIQNQFDEMKKFFQDLANKIMNAVKDVKAPENNDHASLMNAIASAISKPITDAADAFEAAANDSSLSALTNAINAKEDNDIKKLLNSLVSSAVAEALKNNTEIADLKKKNEDLEKEITNMKGKPTNSKEEETPKLVGSFN